MVILILFAFLGGIITILSPCILPVLPIVLSGSLTGGKQRPLGIVTGFVISFTFFTLFLSAIVKATNISADTLRLSAVVLLIVFGASLFIPQFQIWMERLFSKLSSLLSQRKTSATDSGFISGIPIGASLGLIWAPCVGPIIASVITLAATSTVNAGAVFITLAYSLGTAIPMLGITYGGRALLNKVPWLLTRAQTIQKAFGILMFVTAIGILFNVDRKFQTYILTAIPSYGTGLTSIEDNPLVQQALQQFRAKPIKDSLIGKPMNELQQQNGSTLPRLAKAPGFTRQSGAWINSPPLTIEELRGKVVLVDFWTYTCINCIRTLPYLRTWHDKYKEKGLVIVGVHTPEFEFEKELKNVQQAVTDFNLSHPIVQDNDFGIWREYDNHYWPAKYLIDKDGYIRYFHFGEGEYDETEQAIQTLLSEAGTDITEAVNNPSYSVYGKTRELYLGYDRIEFNVSMENIRKDTLMTYSRPKTLPQNRFSYEGPWIIGNERAMPKTGAKLSVRFDAKEVFLVMRPTESGKTATIRVYFNDQIVPAIQSGSDVQNGIVTVSTDRLYKLIDVSEAGSAILTLEFLDDNGELYAFTFG